MSDALRYVFANAAIAVTVRADKVAVFNGYKRDLCRSLAVGFGLSQSYGDSVFTHANEIGSTTLIGFDDGSVLASYEDTVRGIIDSDTTTSTLALTYRRLLACLVNGILFGHAIYNSSPITDIVDVIGNTLYQAARRIISPDLYEVTDSGTVIHPFTATVVKRLIGQLNYPSAISQINSSPKDMEVELVHYNYYDVSGVFQGPDLDRMKDAENQYYYISGGIIYSQMPSGLAFCEERQIQIPDTTGYKTITIINNHPCIDEDSFTAPLTGNKFYRVFNDGPYSSGNFSKTVKTAYQDFDRSVLSGVQYSGNLTKLFSYTKIGTGSSYHSIYDGIPSDMDGEYNITQEYVYAPADTGCLPKYQIMHIGDASFRNICTSFNTNGSCKTCVEQVATGLKYVTLELDEDIWSDRFAYVQTNPPTPLKRTLTRAFSMSTNPYGAIASDSGLIAAKPDGKGGHNWYIGPPQMGVSELPFFAFEQSFNSYTFNKKAAVTLYPAIGTSSTGGYGPSNRSYVVSSRPLVSGLESSLRTVQQSYEDGVYPKAAFIRTISAFDTGDDVRTKFLSMGNAFDGAYQITGSSEENAGYFYSGYTLNQGGVILSETEAAALYESYKIGSPYNEIQYISGYSGKNNLEISRQIAQDGSGNAREYYYFDNRTMPGGVTVDQTGWNEFAPLPTGIEADTGYARAYATQRVENSYQRYYRGPYATYVNKFLYPNAKVVQRELDDNNGFPVKYLYKVIVREEAIKELYATFAITNGYIYNIPTYIPVVRPTGSNFGAYIPVMVNMFSAAGQNFDFTKWNTGKVASFAYDLPLYNAVDNNYAPVTDSYVVSKITYPLYTSGKNAHTYVNQPTFKQGILITGNSAIQHRHYSGVGRTSGTFSYSVVPTAVGLYHRYSNYDLTGYITYTKPLFNLEAGKIDKSQATGAMPLTSVGCTSYFYDTPGPGFIPSVAEGVNHLYTKELNGNIFYSQSGQDPIYWKYIGGRRGATATGQGGYHEKGIIGDSWMGLNIKEFGCWCSAWTDVCPDGNFDGNTYKNYSIDAETNDNRIASEDERWFYLNADQSNLKFIARGLDYNPMAFNYVNPPYTAFSTAPTNSKGVAATFDSTVSAFKLDLSSVFPLKSIGTYNEWYVNPSGSGVTIGPFDRDVEFFVNSGVTLAAHSYFYINQRLMSDYASGASGICDAPTGLFMDAFDDGAGWRSARTKAIAFIPSGQSAMLNVKAGVNAVAKIGFPSKSYLHIRARTPFGEQEFDSDTQAYLRLIGSNFWQHNFNLINNGSEREFSISNGGETPADYAGTTKTFVTFSRSGKLYPIPDDTEFDAYRSMDKYGNDSYSIAGVEDFYRKKTAAENNTVYFSGWREGSRISFEIVKMDPVYDEAPYAGHTIVIPSGNAVISGEMGYLKQADSTIFTEGFELEDVTAVDPIREVLYAPQYVSPVLKRVPYYTYPTGTYKNPVQEAPSVMKQRVEEQVSPEQTYSGLFTEEPYNYNKLLWPALSDLRTLNPEETLEEIPPNDGNTFVNSTMLISAAQGQPLPNGDANPDSRKVYNVRAQYQMYDSVATDALANPQYFLTSGHGRVTQLTQPQSGVTVPVGTSLTEVVLGLV